MEIDELPRFVVETCDRLQLTYLVTGSTASIAYREPRFTNDIEIVIDLSVNQVDAFCDAFPDDEFYLNWETVRTSVRDAFPYNLIHPVSGLKVDFL